MIVLTLDPNVISTGYVLYDTFSGTILCSGTINTPASKKISPELRMLEQRRQLELIINDTIECRIDLVIAEGIFGGPNPMVPIVLGLLTGILIGGLCDDYHRMPNTTWWLRVTGRGCKDYDGNIKDEWKKSKCFTITNKLLGRDPHTEHEMDATSILVAYLNGGKYVKRVKKRKRKK